MKKLYTTLIISFFILNTKASWSTAQGNIFSDVQENTTYQTSIENLYQQGIIKGYPDGSFRPNNTINRAEFVKILMESVFDEKTFKTCMTETDEIFPDIENTSWYAKYVCIAKKGKIIEGYPDNTFKGGNFVNMAEASKIIINTFLLDITTIRSGQEWYEPYIRSLDEKKIIPNSIENPWKQITRGEMSEMIYRIRQKIFKTNDQNITNKRTTTKTPKEISMLKNSIIELVNRERTSRGMSTLKNNHFLEQSSQLHSDDMRKRKYFDHINPEGKTPDNRIEDTGYLQAYKECKCSKSYTTGENLAKGQETATEVMKTWMESVKHRENILNPDFSEIGIGITKIDSTDSGFVGYFWVQNFGNIKLE